MATAESVKGKIQGLIDSANAATGNADTDLTSAVGALIAGFGQGDGGLAYDMGDIVLDADKADRENIPHNLGSVPDFILVWSDDFVNRELPTDYSDNVGFVYMRDLCGLPVGVTSALTSANGIICRITRQKNATINRLTLVIPTSEAYMFLDSEITDTTFDLITNGASNRWRSGVTYHYFVSKAWWNLMEVTV